MFPALLANCLGSSRSLAACHFPTCLRTSSAYWLEHTTCLLACAPNLIAGLRAHSPMGDDVSSPLVPNLGFQRHCSTIFELARPLPSLKPLQSSCLAFFHKRRDTLPNYSGNALVACWLWNCFTRSSNCHSAWAYSQLVSLAGNLLH